MPIKAELKGYQGLEFGLLLRQMKKFISFFTLGLVAALADPAFAQVLPNLPTPTKGETINMSIQTGTRSQLSFGSNTSFGTSVNASVTEGTSASAYSSLAPTAGGSLSLAIGATPSTPSVTTAKIDNLKATTATGSDSSGNANLTGVQGKLEFTLDAARTEFKAQTQTLHQTYGTDGQHGTSLGKGNQISTAGGSANVNSNTNVDINSSAFTSMFSQAY